MQSARLWLAVCLIGLCQGPNVAVAQDLDTGHEFWQSTWKMLGYDSMLYAPDTVALGGLQVAVNTALRDYATQIGIWTIDTITVEYHTYGYALKDSMIEGGLAHMPIRAFYQSADGSEYFGMTQVEYAYQLGSVLESGPHFMSYMLSGDILRISAAATTGATIYVDGPAKADLLIHGADTTNVYDGDRSAVVIRAAYWLAVALEHTGAPSYLTEWNRHVAARVPKAAVMGVQ